MGRSGCRRLPTWNLRMLAAGYGTEPMIRIDHGCHPKKEIALVIMTKETTLNTEYAHTAYQSITNVDRHA